MKAIELAEMCGGALQEKFAKAFEKVMENMQDPNTPYKDKRAITIKFTFAQNEERDDVAADIDVSVKLASLTGIRTSFSTGTDLRTGEVYAEEYGKQVKGQTVIRDVQPDKAVGEIAVNPETGEVIGELPKVVDLRKVAY